jgi:hypothetical protein
MNPNEVIGLAGVPVIVALVEVGKRAWPEMPERLYPLACLVVALVLNLGLGLHFGADVITALITGLIAGLAASGLYSQAKAMLEPAQ